MRNRKVTSSHCAKKSSNPLLEFARSTNSDLFLYFVHSFPYKTDKSIARSTNLSNFLYFARNYDTKLAREVDISSNSADELSYFAEKFAYGGGIAYFCLPCI